MPRPNINEYFLDMLSQVASRSTCIRRKVACIITDKEHHVLAMGYNGVPVNFDHCIDHPCAGAKDQPGQTDNCMAVHSEQSALLQCTDLDRAHTMYVSCLPCFVCAKMIANTKIRVVICSADYADKRGLNVLLNADCVVKIGNEIHGMQI